MVLVSSMALFSSHNVVKRRDESGHSHMMFLKNDSWLPHVSSCLRTIDVGIAISMVAAYSFFHDCCARPCLTYMYTQAKKRIVVYVKERERENVERPRRGDMDGDDDNDKGLSGMLSNTLGKLLGRKDQQDSITIDVVPADRDELEWARMVAGDGGGAGMCMHVFLCAFDS